MAEDHPRTHEELVVMVEEAIRPLAAAGDPIAELMLRCLTCENENARCGDCWSRAKDERSAARDAAAPAVK